MSQDLTNRPQPKAYSYIRFSTPEQSLGDSKRRQLAKAREYALRHGLDLVEEAYEDLGVSAYRGRNKEEGALADFLTAVKDGAVARGSYLLVESMDRLSRQAARWAVRSLESIVDAGVVVVTLADGREYSTATLDEDPMAFMYAYMVAIRAHEESHTKAMRLRDVWGRKKQLAADERRPATARAPAWLTLSEDRTEFEIIESRAEIVRRIFKEALEGVGQHTIAQRLNAEGVETFGDGKRRAAYWHRSYIAKILQSPAVVGTFVPHETREVGGKKTRDPLAPIPGYFPAVVDQKTYKAVQDRLAGRNTPRMRAEKGEVSNILAGLAKCPLCASTMTRVNKGRKGGTPYLVCTKAKAGAGCDYNAVKLVMVEYGILHAGTRALVHDVPTGDPEVDLKLRMATDDWSDLQGVIKRLTDEIANGNPSPAIRQRLSEAERDLRETEETITKLEAQGKKTNKRALARVVKNLEHTLGNPSATVTQRNTALRDAFTHVVVDHRSGDLWFHWKQGGNPTVVPYTVVDL